MTTTMNFSQILFILTAFPAIVVALISPLGGAPPLKQHQHQRYGTALFMDRRVFFLEAMSVVTATATATAVVPLSAHAAMKAVPDELEVFKPGTKLSIEDAKKRFLLAKRDAHYLLDNYTEITKKGGGDAVRNYLGTQGVTSGMYGITKVLKLLQDEADDIVEYTETMQEFNAYLYQAEGAAYQSMFADGSSSRSTSASLLATAKVDLAQMCKYMDQLSTQLNL